jgi:hypothetical protein
MVTLRNFILACLALLVLTQCKSKEDSANQRPPSSSFVGTKNKSNFNGRWRYSMPFYYSELILNGDGTFTFHDQGCYGQRFSQGQWTNEKNIVRLISFDTFKQIEQAEKKIINDATQQKTTKKSNAEYSYVDLKKVAPPVLLGPNDTVRVYLNKVLLQFTNDTLFCIGTNRLPEDARFHRTKNNR